MIRGSLSRFVAAATVLLSLASPAGAEKVSAKKSGDVHRGAPVWRLEGIIKRREAKALEKCRSDRSASEKAAMRSEERQPCSWGAPASFTDRAREICAGGTYSVRIEELTQPGRGSRLTVIGPYGSHTSYSGPSDSLTWYLVCDAEVRVEPADRCEALTGEARKKCFREESQVSVCPRCNRSFRGETAFREHWDAGCRPVLCEFQGAYEGFFATTSSKRVCVCRKGEGGTLEWRFKDDGTKCDWDK